MKSDTGARLALDTQLSTRNSTQLPTPRHSKEERELCKQKWLSFHLDKLRFSFPDPCHLLSLSETTESQADVSWERNQGRMD